jgi:hypothetical protein
MRKLLISIATAASVVAIAAPASAQYYPQPRGYGYGYNNNYGSARSLHARVDNLQRRLEQLDRRAVLPDRELRSLRNGAARTEREVREASRNGLNPYERARLEQRVAHLEQRFERLRSYARYERRGGYGNNYGGGYYDRDHDGMDDRYENPPQGGGYYDRDRDGMDDRYEN